VLAALVCGHGLLAVGVRSPPADYRAPLSRLPALALPSFPSSSDPPPRRDALSRKLVMLRNERPSANLSLTKSMLQHSNTGLVCRNAHRNALSSRYIPSLLGAARSTLPLGTADRCVLRLRASLPAAAVPSDADTHTPHVFPPARASVRNTSSNTFRL